MKFIKNYENSRECYGLSRTVFKRIFSEHKHYKIKLEKYL